MKKMFVALKEPTVEYNPMNNNNDSGYVRIGLSTACFSHTTLIIVCLVNNNKLD